MSRTKNESPELTLDPSPLARETKGDTLNDVLEAPKKTKDFGIDIDPEKVYVFEVIEKSPAQRHEIIGGVDRIYDTIENRIREIRCYSTAASIFVDEQDKQDPLLKTRQPEILDFYNNVLVVNGSDTRKMEYLLSTNSYEGNPKRLSSMPPKYRLQDKEKHESDKAKHNKLEREALNSIAETDLQDLLPIARVFFGITDEGEMAVRNQLADKVKVPQEKQWLESNAKIYLDNLRDPSMIRKYTIQSAIDKGVLIVNNTDKAVRWGKNKQHITNVSNTGPKQLLNDLVAFSMTGTGKEFYSLLRSREAKE